MKKRTPRRPNIGHQNPPAHRVVIEEVTEMGNVAAESHVVTDAPPPPKKKNNRD